MGWTKNAVAGVTLTAFGVALTAEVVEGLKHVQHLHAPVSVFANVGSTSVASMVTSTAVYSGESPLDCGPFRVMYAQAVEMLSDDVSEYLHLAARSPFMLA
jgi:hypothetical protein